MNAFSSTPKRTRRPAAERGQANHGWLHAQHSFSFANYYDPRHMSFRSLRVLNEDRIAPGRGFGSHPHDSMEIFTYIISGELEHKDNMGNGRVIHAGEFQYMSAGDGVLHSEANPSATEHTHLLQIWIDPESPGGTPRYQDLNPADQRNENGLTLLASGDGRDGSIAMRQQAEIYFGDLGAGQELNLQLDAPLQHGWLQLIDGSLTVDAVPLSAGDGLAIDYGTVHMKAQSNTTFLFFQLV
jgi:redox-sensitive bicupin YhaK (pirin superfamily)